MSNHTVSTKGGAMAAEGHKTRRAALRVLAGASALAIPTISSIAAALPDPIFTAIERHKAACNPAARGVSQGRMGRLRPGEGK
jgi:hypothetical protein